jgi:hypothetical protein
MYDDYGAYISEGIQIEDRTNGICCSSPSVANNRRFCFDQFPLSSVKACIKPTTRMQAKKLLWSNPWIGARYCRLSEFSLDEG